MKLQDLKIGQKLALSFGIVLAIFVGSTSFQLFDLNKLGELQDAGAKRAEDLIVVQEASGMGYKVYQVVADAIINRDLQETDKAWTEIKNEMVEDINLVGQAIDTKVEEEYHSEAEQISQEIINHYENELYPLLKNEFSEENEMKIREIDGEIDGLVQKLSVPLTRIVESLAAETKEGDDEYDAMQESVFLISIILLIISIVISVLLVVFITSAIVKGFKGSIKVAEEISNGNLTIDIDEQFLTRKDEIGKLVNSLNNMKEKLRSIIQDINAGADQISTASQELSSTSQEMSQGSSEQASSAEEVSSSMEQMASNIQQNTDNAQQTEKISLKASSDIGEGKDSVIQTVESMKNIADKITIISEIARQTNILALNAAVEAARAGEHGKGFAVVAEEVRKLAARSQEAAKEIDDTSKSSVTIAEKSGKLLEDIVPDIERTAKLVQEIAAASNEQSSGADQVNSAIQQLNQVTQQNAAASEEMATSSEELASQANQLKDAISYFKI